MVDAFCAKIDGPVAFLDLLHRLVDHAQQSGGAAQRCILHVSDDERHRYTISRLLRRAGFRVVEAGNRDEALEQLGKSPDLVLLEMLRPESGIELSRRIKSDPATARIPVLHLSPVPPASRGSGEDLVAVADGYLVQPTPAEEIIAAVNALIAGRSES